MWEINHRWLCRGLCARLRYDRIYFWNVKCVQSLYYMLSALCGICCARLFFVQSLLKSFILNINTRNLGILLDFIMQPVYVYISYFAFDRIDLLSFFLFLHTGLPFIRNLWNISRTRSIMIMFCCCSCRRKWHWEARSIVGDDLIDWYKKWAYIYPFKMWHEMLSI